MFIVFKYLFQYDIYSLKFIIPMYLFYFGKIR